MYATISLQCNPSGLIICQKMERGKSAHNATIGKYKLQHQDSKMDVKPSTKVQTLTRQLERNGAASMNIWTP